MQDNEATIQKFLSGAMNAEEEAAFRKRLKEDDMFYAEYLLETEGKQQR